jgi:predicted O-methyltransferase YrrM
MNEYLNKLNPKRINPVIESILAEANDLKTPIIREDAINFMIQFIKASKIKQVLEIGSAIGYSAIMIATYTDAEVFTIERDELSYLRAKNNIKKANLEDKITIVNQDAVEYQMSEDYKCDLLFIDASKSSYVRFFEKYQKHLNKNGIIISDNLLFHGMVEHPEVIESKNKRQLVRKINNFNEYIVKHPDYDSYIYEIGDGISVSIRKW